MPNWNKEIRQHLVGMNLPPDMTEEIIAELASHLEETYDSARSQGLDAAAALKVTRQGIEDWRVLARNVTRAKGENSMNHRTKRFWLPALITLLGVSAALALIEYIGIQPLVVWVGSEPLRLDWAWIATLPAFGGMGAYLSRRAGATALARLAAGLAPALLMLIVMFLVLPFGLINEGFGFLRHVAFGLDLTTGVAIPGVALFVGIAPFLRETVH